MTISTPVVPETAEEMAARIRGLEEHVAVLAEHAGLHGAHAAQVLRAELDYIAGRVGRGLARPAWGRDHVDVDVIEATNLEDLDHDARERLARAQDPGRAGR